MRERQLRMNFDTEYKIEKDDPIRLLEKIINNLYETEIAPPDEYRGNIPEDIMMKILIYGYMNQAYSFRNNKLQHQSSSASMASPITPTAFYFHLHSHRRALLQLF